MAMTPGTDTGETTAETPIAEQTTEILDQTGETEPTGDETETDAAEDGGMEETGTETEGDGNESDGAEPSAKYRQLQLAFDKQGNELGVLRKLLGTVVERMKSARVGQPTVEELAENPDEAAKKEKALQDEDSRIESELQDAGNRALLARTVPDFEAHIPAVAEFIKKDGADSEYIEAFKKNPYMMDAGLARFIVRIVKAEKEIARLKGTKPMSTKPPLADKKFTPTNDRSGRAPADVKGPVNYKSLAEAIAKDPSSMDEVLSKMTPEQINELLAEDKRIAQARRRRN